TSSALAVQPSEAEVQAAVSGAAAQARGMAETTARAAGVSLGNVQSVATQPPTACYGPTGPMRVVQVTINYAIKKRMEEAAYAAAASPSGIAGGTTSRLISTPASPATSGAPAQR